MSAIASKWAYSQPIKNPTAKNVLAFLASHNFPGNKSFFSVQTISGATAFSRRAVIDALKWLVENKYVVKNIRFDEDGGRQTNVYELNIPHQYVEEFCSEYTKLSVPPVQELHGGGAGAARGGVQELHPNNNINNKSNKSFYKCNEQKASNEKKHDWADKSKSPLADVTKQSTSHDPNREKRADKASALVESYMVKALKER